VCVWGGVVGGVDNFKTLGDFRGFIKIAVLDRFLDHLKSHVARMRWECGNEVITAVVMKMFRDVTSFSPFKVIQYFGGICRFHHQDEPSSAFHLLSCSFIS
jgi:hypothetical protein